MNGGAVAGDFELPRDVNSRRAVPLRGIALGRVYRAATTIYLAALLVSLRFDSLAVPLGLTAGTALSLGIIWSWEFIVSRAFDPAAPRRTSPGVGGGHEALEERRRRGGKSVAIALGLVKLPVLGAIVYFLIGRSLVSAPAFVVGFVIPQVAIGLLALTGRTASREEAPHVAPRA